MTLKTIALATGLLLLAGLQQVRAQSGTQAEFPYPQIPDVYQDVQARARYLAEHYWDRFDFTDTTQLGNPDIVEQGFSNYLDFLPRFSKDIEQASIEIFARKAFANVHSKACFEKLTEHYLQDPQSPFRNDEVYQRLLLEMAKQPLFDETERERLTYKAKVAGMNLPGAQATNFTFIDRQGRRHELAEYQDRPVILYFNDPDCEVCHATTQKLAAQLPTDIQVLAIYADPDCEVCHATTQKLAAQLPTDIQVLAIYADTETDEWHKHPQPFPPAWTDGCSPEGEIVQQHLYDLPAMPTIYLLDKGNTVRLKDCTAEQLLEALKQRQEKDTNKK